MTQAKERSGRAQQRDSPGGREATQLAFGRWGVAPRLANGRYASCDAAALAPVRHLVSEHSKAALAELCDTTSLRRLCISSLKFDRSLEFRRSLRGQSGGLLIMQGVCRHWWRHADTPPEGSAHAK
jgi:hypothetical protein